MSAEVSNGESEDPTIDKDKFKEYWGNDPKGH